MSKNKFLKFLGFGEDENNEYTEQYSGYPGRRRRPYSGGGDTMRGGAYSGNYEDYDDDKYERTPPLRNGLILFKGLPSTEDKLHLREALLDGCIILLDLSGIPAERIEEGRQFITFMHGVSFANGGEFSKLTPRIFSVSPQPGMVQTITGTSTAKAQGDES
ncbi:MAG: cell division protein SepF [Synergistaceae bacterium]|nr:cell division protein SepF [Synergistaceae bacterium]